jgi:TonB family protein
MTISMLNKFAVVLVAIAAGPATSGFAQVTVKPVAAPPGLLSALKGKDPAARRDAANRLGGVRARDSVRPLIEALLDKEASVREAAAFALGQIADRRANDPLLSALSDKDEEVRATIVFALGMLGERKSIKVLSHLLDDGSAAVRSSATVALGLMQDGDAVDEIIAILDDPSIDVRYDAVWALAQIGEPDALDHLKAVLVNLDLVKVDDAALEGLRQAVQNSMEILQAKSELRSARKRRANAPSQPSGGSGKVSYSMELHPAKIVQSVQPAPTERAVKARVRGTVAVRVLVAADGRAARAYVTRRLGYGLDQRAVEAAMQYKFDPAMQAGLPQTSWMELEIRY